MLNGDLADAARKELEGAIQAHADVVQRATEVSVELYELRMKASHKLIPQVEAYVNTLAATPKEFDKTFEEFHIQVAAFDKVVQGIEESMIDAVIKGGASAGAGIAAGAANAFAAPTAAMAIATTFGTASTGTAISALSGAAATNAALAWLGGGALAGRLRGTARSPRRARRHRRQARSAQQPSLFQSTLHSGLGAEGHPWRSLPGLRHAAGRRQVQPL